ncbi:MAG: hypothetical protein GY710_20035 [Desulfobacteraceae bacterium]|nr:hypothetical protein [Desulfobacteraceae bacterium]
MAGFKDKTQLVHCTQECCSLMFNILTPASVIIKNMSALTDNKNKISKQIFKMDRWSNLKKISGLISGYLAQLILERLDEKDDVMGLAEDTLLPDRQLRENIKTCFQSQSRIGGGGCT